MVVDRADEGGFRLKVVLVVSSFCWTKIQSQPGNKPLIELGSLPKDEGDCH